MKNANTILRIEEDANRLTIVGWSLEVIEYCGK